MRVDTGRLRVVSGEAPALEASSPADSAVSVAVDRRSASAGAAAGATAAAAQRDSQPELREQDDAAESFESPGPYIRAQRMRRGLSLDQLAAQTKIPRGQLELLEADRYEELPGMVFAKGFLRCCARTLELDEDTVLGLLYERERAALRQRRREGSSATPVDSRQVLRPARRAKTKARAEHPAQKLLDGVLDYGRSWVADLPRAQILMWLVVALLVALVVFIAFTLASSQAATVINS